MNKDKKYLVIRYATTYFGGDLTEDHIYVHKWFDSRSEANEYIKNVSLIISDLQNKNPYDCKYVEHELKNTHKLKCIKPDKIRDIYVIESTGDIHQSDSSTFKKLYKYTKKWVELDKISSFHGSNYKEYPKHNRKDAKKILINPQFSQFCYILYNEELQIFGRVMFAEEEDDFVQNIENLLNEKK